MQEVQVNPLVNNHFPPPCSYVSLNVCKTVLEDLEHVLHWSQFEASFPFCSGLLRYLTWNRLMVHWYFAIHVEIYHSTSSGKKNDYLMHRQDCQDLKMPHDTQHSNFQTPADTVIMGRCDVTETETHSNYHHHRCPFPMGWLINS